MSGKQKSGLVRGATTVFFLATAALLWRELGRTGLISDEGRLGAYASYMLWGEPALELLQNPFQQFAGRILLQYSFYVGPWNCYAVALMLWLTQDKVLAIKLVALTWGLLGVWACYRLSSVCSCSRRTGLLSAAVLVTSPFFLSMLRADFFLPAIFFTAFAFAMLFKVVRTGRDKHWLLSLALVGMGIGFSHPFLAAAASFLLLAWRHRRRLPILRPGKTPTSRLALSTALLSVGIFPLVLANMLNGWQALTWAFEFLFVSLNGVHNDDYLRNLAHRLGDLVKVFGLPGLSLSGLALALYAIGRQRSSPNANTAGSLWVATAPIVLLSPLTFCSLVPPHLASLFPIVLAAIAATPCAISAAHGRWRATAPLVLGLWLGVNVLSRARGRGTAVPEAPRQILDVARWADNRTGTYSTFSFSTYWPLIYLMKNSQNIDCFIGRRSDPVALERHVGAMIDQSHRHGAVLMTGDPLEKPALTAMASAARRRGKKIVLAEQFRAGDGSVVYRVYEFR